MDRDPKIKRWMAGKQFSRSLKRMITTLEGVQTIPKRTISRRYDELKTKWNTCKEAHNFYLASLTQSNKEAEEK